MKIPCSMLRDYVSTSLAPEQIGDLLTMAGFELEGIENVEGDAVLDIKVMANRGDGLAARGLAREILAKDASAKPTALYAQAAGRFGESSLTDEGPTDSAAFGGIEIQTENCTRYAARVFTDVQNGTSPDWLQQRLRQAGQRPISLLVDLTNYVMLELGQPLHAFDLPKLGGQRIVVRQAASRERLTTLNGDEHELDPSMMVIADASKPVALAGVMGGLETEVSEATKTMLLESAHFNSRSVRKTRKNLGLSTEASYRFERSVDPAGVVAALNRFAALYELCLSGEAPEPGAELPVPAGYVVDSWPIKPVETPIPCRHAKVERLLGMQVGMPDCIGYLERLGFEVRETPSGFDATPPTWRPDVEIEEDVIEEIGRVHGYDRIPETMPQAETTQGGVFGLPALLDSVRIACLRSGLTQTISHTLRDAHPLDFSPDWRIGPKNPHSPEMALLRDSLLPGLAEAAQRNGARNLHLFELGRVFLRGEYQVDESPELAILSTGELYPDHWSEASPARADFFSIKGIVEEIAKRLDVHIIFDHPRDPDSRFHPTRQSGVLVDEGRLWVGTIGQIHPDVAAECGLPEQTVLAELDLLVLHIQHSHEFSMRPISRNPAVRRDIAVVIDKAVPYSQVESAVAAVCGDLLERQWLVSTYEGKGIPDGSHSLAIAIQLRKMGQNMTDEEANAIRDKVVKSLESLGATLRV